MQNVFQNSMLRAKFLVYKYCAKNGRVKLNNNPKCQICVLR